jgi:hypothetical protein
MISEFEFYHGVVFARMLHAMQRELAIKPYSPSDNAAYVVDGSIGIYIKYSTKRLLSFAKIRSHRCLAELRA